MKKGRLSMLAIVLSTIKTHFSNRHVSTAIQYRIWGTMKIDSTMIYLKSDKKTQQYMSTIGRLGTLAAT